MFKSVRYLVGVGLLASATAAAAVELPPEVLDSVMAACRPDYHRVCSFVAPGDGRVGRCLLEHELELAPPCLKAIKIAHAMEACMPEYRRFCNGVAAGGDGGQVVQCLAERMEALAPECQRVVSANAPYAAPGHDRYGDNRGPAPYGEAYRFDARPGEGQPYPDEGVNRDRAYDDRYADRSYDRYGGPPYGERQPYSDQGYNGPGYPQPAPGYQEPGNYPSPGDEPVPLK